MHDLGGVIMTPGTPGNLRRTLRPRGAVLVAVIIALVIMQLLAAGLVTAGSRDHDLTARRAETMRAFYAAEAGMNMALREVMVNADEDGDSGVGTISDDGAHANDPAIGGARVQVASTAGATSTTLTSAGRIGEARRSVAAILE